MQAIMCIQKIISITIDKVLSIVFPIIGRCAPHFVTIYSTADLMYLIRNTRANRKRVLQRKAQCVGTKNKILLTKVAVKSMMKNPFRYAFPVFYIVGFFICEGTVRKLITKSMKKRSSVTTSNTQSPILVSTSIHRSRQTMKLYSMNY